jgi:hypothetical protein
MIIKLPCGLLIEDTVYDHVRIEEIKGKQQNYLMDAELTVDNFGHVPKIVGELAVDYQTKGGQPADIDPKKAVWLLPTEDIEVILLKIREATYGEVFAMPTACAHCNAQQTKRIDLDKLEIKSLKKKKQRTKVIKLPKTGIEAEVKLLYLKDLFAMYEAIKDKGSTLFTATNVLSVARLGDKSPVTEEDLEAIAITDLQLIVETYMALRGSIDLMITHECDSCKKDFETPLPVMDPLFFVQSETHLT